MVDTQNFPDDSSPSKPVAEFSEDQLSKLQFAIKERRKLSTPTILIVEDQVVSRTLLEETLQRQKYICESAENGIQAINLYAEFGPCITLLDIELPDIDGHRLAALFKKHDPESYIVMVTANNYIKDVEAAKTNQVQGFIAKPYNQQKILAVINSYIAQKKNRW